MNIEYISIDELPSVILDINAIGSEVKINFDEEYDYENIEEVIELDVFNNTRIIICD